MIYCPQFMIAGGDKKLPNRHGKAVQTTVF
jgi:hypothetical protein